MDNNIMGGVYLCQINDNVSCGACCGLYNVADPSYGNLWSLLERRTLLYEKTPRNYDDLEDFARIITASENQDRPYPEFHHCPYIGLIGETRQRPGCLLHPLGAGNNKTDFRGLSHWGGFACASYFCPTCHEVPARFKEIMKGCAENWYLFGLNVTESDYVSSYFEWIEEAAGKRLIPSEVLACVPFTSAVREFLALKLTWPYRNKHDNRLGNYFFKDDLYPRASINYPAFGLQQPPRSDLILRTLNTSCRDKKNLTCAMEHIAQLICKAVQAVTQIS